MAHPLGAALPATLLSVGIVTSSLAQQLPRSAASEPPPTNARNQASATQDGSANQASIDQTGGNAAIVVQRGTGNIARVQQHGLGSQASPDEGRTVIQSIGPNGQITIRQGP